MCDGFVGERRRWEGGSLEVSCFVASGRRRTGSMFVTGVQTCALPILPPPTPETGK